VKKLFNFIIFILLLILILSPASEAEDGPDAVLKKGMDYYREGKLDRAEDEYNKALYLYQTEDNKLGEGLCYFKLGEVFFALALYDNSI